MGAKRGNDARHKGCGEGNKPPGQAQEACSGARTKREQLGPPQRPRRELTTGPVPGIVLQARHLAGQNILGKHERVR